MYGTDEKCIKKFWPEIHEGKNHSKVLGISGRIILEWIFKSSMGRFGLDSSGLG